MEQHPIQKRTIPNISGLFACCLDPGKSLLLRYSTKVNKDSQSMDFHVMKPSIDKTSKKKEEEKGGACLGPDIITYLPAGQPAHMSKVNTHVRGQGSTDRHDEWPEVPTRRHTYKRAQTERKVMCGQPLQYCNTDHHSHTALTLYVSSLPITTVALIHVCIHCKSLNTCLCATRDFM